MFNLSQSVIYDYIHVQMKNVASFVSNFFTFSKYKMTIGSSLNLLVINRISFSLELDLNEN